jgi:hypothetical protein
MKYTKEIPYYDAEEDYYGKEERHYYGFKAFVLHAWDSLKWLWWAIAALLTLLLLLWVVLMVFTDFASPFVFIYEMIKSIFGS